MLAGAVPPTGQRFVGPPVSDETMRRYTGLYLNNEKSKRQIQKYRVTYWAKNQIDETFLRSPQYLAHLRQQMNE